MAHEVSILNDTTFWYGVAFFLCVVLIVKTAGKGIISALDGQIARIRHELDEAKRLRAEAEEALMKYKQRQDEAMREAEGIVAEAKALAARIRKEAEIELETTLCRHEQMAIDKINAAKEEAAAEVRAHLVREALVEARGKLAKDLAEKGASGSVDKAIAELSKAG